MIAYFRRLRGDSSLLPPVFRLRLIVLDGGFNSFRMPPVWNSFFAFANKVPCSVYPGGDPDKWVYVAITTVPMG